MQRLFYVVSVIVLGLVLASCKEDEPVGNSAPDTRLMADSIQLTGPDRLLTRVRLYWNGDDRDGFVQRFEISFDSLVWYTTTKTDSLLELALPLGQDTADIRFWVRAVDDQGTADPTPAYLLVPIRNSAPAIQFDPNALPLDTIYSVLTFGYLPSDPDGIENVNRVEVRLNDGPWTEINFSTRILTLRSLNPTATGPTTAEVFRDLEGTFLPGVQFTGFNLNGLNTVYVRCFDLAGIESNTDTLADIFIRNQSSEVLMLDAWPGTPPATLTYLPMVEADSAFGNIDFLNLVDTNNVPALPVLTLGKLIELYEVLFFNVDGTSDNLDFVENLEGALQQHLADNGKLWLNVTLSSALSTESSIYRYGIIERLAVVTTGTVRLPNTNNGGQLTPIAVPDITYPTLLNLSGSLLGGFLPFKPAAGAEPLYTGNFTPSPWPDTAATTLIVRRKLNGVTNLVYSGFPMKRLVDASNQNPALGSYFVRLKQDFGL